MDENPYQSPQETQGEPQHAKQQSCYGREALLSLAAAFATWVAAFALYALTGAMIFAALWLWQMVRARS